MESPSVMRALPCRQEPREGQRRVFEALELHEQFMNIQLPTGYGKTFTAAGCYAIKQQQGAVNRLLMIFPTDAQLEQFSRDSTAERSDVALAGVEGQHGVSDVRFFGAEAIRHHRSNKRHLFAITVQALIQARGADNVHELMQTGRWMVVVDEYHHYGIDKAWGKSVRALPAVFMLAMSATPTRPNDDSAFGKPDITVKYEDAANDERAVKKLRGHAYHYRIDALDPEGTVHTYTTAELAREAGNSPEAVERWRIERKMRWSPKYIAPLVTNPIERMQRMRVITGQPLQVLVGAMCVSHAEQVCSQISAIFPELRVDWVGTGMNGRSDAQNKEVISKFCPPKKDNGRREPTLDVLVHVGMAGEGLDSPYVTEVVHLNNASRNNSNDQENGRAARVLYDTNRKPIEVEGNINFDATSEYAQFVGPSIMQAMDGALYPVVAPDDLRDDATDFDLEFQPLPEEPAILIYDMELEHIDSGDPGVMRFVKVLEKHSDFDTRDFYDSESPRHAEAVRVGIEAYRAMRRQEAEDNDSQSVVMQWNDHVNRALAIVVALAVRTFAKGGHRVEKSLAGDVKRRINTQKKRSLGELTKDTEVCRTHYHWLRNLEQDILANGIPPWLW